MTAPSQHLTEEERQTLADGTMDPARSGTAAAHTRVCVDCATDIARIRMLMARTRDASAPPEALDELWPAIRSRLDARKVVSIAAGAPDAAPVVPRRTRHAFRAGLLGAAAAAAAVVITLLPVRQRNRAGDDAGGRQRQDKTPPFVAVVDSARSYEAEARSLLDRLELQRAVIRPEAARLLERDLRSVDVAIAELKDAIARDPNNPTLRQLLASSYRQKIDLLRRAGNAG